MERGTWAKIAQAGHDAQEQEARRRLEAGRQWTRDFERQRRQEKDALRNRQTSRLSRIEECCTDMERAFRLFQENYQVIDRKKNVYNDAIRILQDHLKDPRQSVNAVSEAKKANYLSVQECLQRIIDLGEARDQILQARNKIANIGVEYDSEKGRLSSSQEEDIKIMERAEELKARKEKLVEDYDKFNQSAKENGKKIESLYDTSDKILKLIKEKKGR
jgi:chromosome segregation ATPase